LTQNYSGRLRNLAGYQAGLHELLVAVPCRIGPDADPTYALLDTGSEWNILDWLTAVRLGYDSMEEGASISLSSRFGIARGRLIRIPMGFDAAEGEDLELEATWFVSEEWPGPTVIGWRGCLERIRFAFDTDEEWFYFGPSRRGAG
jgi:hypothetical protein